MKYGLLGSGSWATAIAKIITGNGQAINWWIRDKNNLQKIAEKKHNPHYVSSITFNTTLLQMNTDLATIVQQSDVLIIAIPSAYIPAAMEGLNHDSFKEKKILSAVKGIIRNGNLLVNEYLSTQFNIKENDYAVISGPCHAEEVAEEKLSYLTFSSIKTEDAAKYALDFSCDYIRTIVNNDVPGVQYAAVLKNIYALGAGIAHGLDYGDNFMSVYMANAADEMVGFLKKVVWDKNPAVNINYAASAYLGDLLVTGYSLHSRNRRFGNYIGKHYSVAAAQLEMNMVAEGYYAAKGMYEINKKIGANMPIASAIYKILWEEMPPAEAFVEIEKILI
jgi:glycerol-3-phosphate dehydrogenase (NAD(P)+)